MAASNLARIASFWPRDWLNDGVRTYLSPQVDGPQEHHALLRAYPSEQEPGLRVFVPSPEYVLTRKLMAMRLDPTDAKSDVTDILNLLDIVRLTTPEDVINFAAVFYPEARIRPPLGAEAPPHGRTGPGSARRVPGRRLLPHWAR